MHCKDAADENGTIRIWDITKGEYRAVYQSNTEEEGYSFRFIAVCESVGFMVGYKSSGICCFFDYGGEKN